VQAFDICPSNLPLNRYAQKLNATYDKDGDFAQAGVLDDLLLQKLNKLEYYTKNGPKSLGTEWLDKSFYPLILSDADPYSVLRTISSHIAAQISATLNAHKIQSVFFTGGGAKNKFILTELQKKYSGKMIVPDTEIIDFKEALIFAFLGYCYLLNRSTTIETVTGATLSLSTGVYHKPGYPTYPKA
jgi:anhydro-N-acetylmuramic acid kinase